MKQDRDAVLRQGWEEGVRGPEAGSKEGRRVELLLRVQGAAGRSPWGPLHPCPKPGSGPNLSAQESGLIRAFCFCKYLLIICFETRKGSIINSRAHLCFPSAGEVGAPWLGYLPPWGGGGG